MVENPDDVIGAGTAVNLSTFPGSSPIFGAFDHAALFVSQLAQLPLPPKQVGATYKTFLDALLARSAPLHAVFTSERNSRFLARIAALRHHAAHRGSLAPSTVFRTPEREATLDELDEDIRAQGLDAALEFLPEGDARDDMRKLFRSNARMERIRGGTILEGVVPIELDGEFGFVDPLLDTAWNYQQVMRFLDELLIECTRFLS